MNNSELAVIALDKAIKAAIEVRDAILSKREELAELNNDIQDMLDEMFEQHGSYATEIERIRDDFENAIGEALTDPEFTAPANPEFTAPANPEFTAPTDPEFTAQIEPILDTSQVLPVNPQPKRGFLHLFKVAS